MHLIQNFFNKVYRNYLFKLWVEPGNKIQYNENHYEIMGFWSSCCNNLASGSQNGHSHSHSHKWKYCSLIEWLSSCLQVRVVNVVFGSWNNIWKIEIDSISFTNLTLGLIGICNKSHSRTCSDQYGCHNSQYNLLKLYCIQSLF